MAKCISPSAGHSSSTNVLIVGAGWCWGNEERGSLEGGRDLGCGPRSCPTGAAGLLCAETLRQEGFSDRIVLCTLDRHLPYDRAKLSKVRMGWGTTWILIPLGSCHILRGAWPVTQWRSGRLFSPVYGMP